MGSPCLVFVHLGGGQDVPYTGAGGLPGRTRRTVPTGGAGAQADLPARASAEMVQFAPTFGVSPSEKSSLDLITDHLQIAN